MSTPSEHVPPPIYSQEDPDESWRAESNDPVPDTPSAGPQIFIVPASDTINFQKGYVGADGERAAIEGELQIKCADAIQWNNVTMTLRTVETAYGREIELGSSTVELFSSSDSTFEALPASFPFAIPLTQDSPQCVHTPQSSLSHVLTATLRPSDPSRATLTKSLTVHTRRYTSHSSNVVIAPETHSLDAPTRVEVEVPRSTFRAGEPVPIYVTVPPPKREVVVEQGLRLRNVRAELIRVVKVRRDDDGDGSSDSDIDPIPEEHESFFFNDEGPSTAAASTSVEKQPSSSVAGHSPIFQGSSYRTVVSRSGASCRFHSSRPIRLRFVLHQPSPSGSPSDLRIDLPNADHGHLDNDTECASITQSTLLHSVTFRIHIHVSFVDMSSRTERFHTISIPVIVIPPPAPLPEVEGQLDAEYQKKHDRPPTRTVRHDDSEVSAPHYEGEAGPSSGAPPPFEERDAPPPFSFEAAAAASTSTRLPTFLESETEIFVPHDQNEDDSSACAALPMGHGFSSIVLVGEGTQFGFRASAQFDGHTEDMTRSSTPPPTLEMASRDANVTDLAELGQPARAMEALGLVLEQQQQQHDEAHDEIPPPPPPAMDDPSDPPPSIDDSGFRSTSSRSVSPRPSVPSFGQAIDGSLHAAPSPGPPSTRQERPLSQGHAPPPYLVPDNDGESEAHVIRPPPYIDLMPSHGHSD
ncbi:hypothetical protein PLICRDRAFT_102166 [Plicaturopsis crispa FD-325 SS-3]|nr:hypothetical protein PLICRDRAFT_102166 [Plicaturopsis crispa FD-325 SS-3]